MTGRVRAPLRAALAVAALVLAGLPAGHAAASDSVPCDEASLAHLKKLIKDSRGKAPAEATKKAERQFELAHKAYVEGKGRLCSLALKKGFAVIQGTHE